MRRCHHHRRAFGFNGFMQPSERLRHLAISVFGQLFHVIVQVTGPAVSHGSRSRQSWAQEEVAQQFRAHVNYRTASRGFRDPHTGGPMYFVRGQEASRA